uniref:Uncharacterized protein n=1 Tax=viral metagenome TaxID=1070528 RepID=A0A6C0HL85_9ZZZZ
MYAPDTTFSKICTCAIIIISINMIMLPFAVYKHNLYILLHKNEHSAKNTQNYNNTSNISYPNNTIHINREHLNTKYKLSLLKKYDICDKIFDVQILSYCNTLNELQPGCNWINKQHLNKNMNKNMNKKDIHREITVTYYNLIPGVNYANINYCWFTVNDYTILLNLKKLDVTIPYIWTYTRPNYNVQNKYIKFKDN